MIAARFGSQECKECRASNEEAWRLCCTLLIQGLQRLPASEISQRRSGGPNATAAKALNLTWFKRIEMQGASTAI